MKKITIIGKFHTDKGVVDGQAIKTSILASEIEALPENHPVLRINTFGWKHHPMKLVRDTFHGVSVSDDVILMTDAGGIKVFPWLLLISRINRKCRLHYVVIGGWLNKMLKKYPPIAFCLKRFDAVYVETLAMKKGLDAMGFRNAYILRNCKPLEPLTPAQLCFSVEEPYKLCIFSRIMREKGVDTAVEAVISANERYGRPVFTLDIYGQVDDEQVLWFEELSASFPREIRYCGVVPYDESVAVIRPYFALLFPTKFYTEGIPGTIIDAYAAGVPVIASEWENFSDIVDDGRTGIGYPFDRPDQLKEILAEIPREPEKILQMKQNCLLKVQEYLPQNALTVLWKVLFGNTDSNRFRTV